MSRGLALSMPAPDRAQVDILFTDLSTGELAFEVVVEAEFGNC